MNIFRERRDDPKQKITFGYAALSCEAAQRKKSGRTRIDICEKSEIQHVQKQTAISLIALLLHPRRYFRYMAIILVLLRYDDSHF